MFSNNIVGLKWNVNPNYAAFKSGAWHNFLGWRDRNTGDTHSRLGTSDPTD
jgi:hypothetical protein